MTPKIAPPPKDVRPAHTLGMNALYFILAPANTDVQLDAILALEASLVLPSFTASDAWTLGTALRARLLAAASPVVISIALANSQQLLFHCTTRSGTAPDNDTWVARKRATVLRWGNSSWWMHIKMAGDEARFREKYMLGEQAGSFAIHGGGVPVRVRGVEGVVAVVVVSGLRQEEDHMAVVEALAELKGELEREAKHL